MSRVATHCTRLDLIATTIDDLHCVCIMGKQCPARSSVDSLIAVIKLTMPDAGAYHVAGFRKQNPHFCVIPGLQIALTSNCCILIVVPPVLYNLSVEGFRPNPSKLFPVLLEPPNSRKAHLCKQKKVNSIWIPLRRINSTPTFATGYKGRLRRANNRNSIWNSICSTYSLRFHVDLPTGR